MNEEDVAQLEKGNIPSDEAVLTAIGSALGLNGVLFALRLLEAKQKDEIYELKRRIHRASDN